MSALRSDLEVVSLDTVRTQLKARDIRLPGHATASLERTRQAIVQLSLAGLITGVEFARLEKRFQTRLVPRVIKVYQGSRGL